MSRQQDQARVRIIHDGVGIVYTATYRGRPVWNAQMLYKDGAPTQIVFKNSVTGLRAELFDDGAGHICQRRKVGTRQITESVVPAFPSGLFDGGKPVMVETPAIRALPDFFAPKCVP